MRVKIKDIAKQIRGVSYKPIDVMDSLTKSSITLLRANNISDGFINFEEVAFINKQRVKGNQLLRKGDILICTSSGSKALVGKAAYVDKDMSMTFGAFCKVVRTIKGNARYLGYFFDSPYYRSIISNASAGANINNIKTNDIDNLEVKWPNIERQNEIAEILDKVTSIIDLRKHQIVELNQLTKSRFIEMFGDSQSNPKGFPYKRINEFAKCIAGATPSTKRKEYWSNGIIPWMSSGEVNYKRIWETEKRISQIGYDSCSTKMIPAHTVVIAMAGQGRTRGTVAVAEIPLCTNQSLCSIITDGTVDTDYLFTYLQFQYNNLRNISNGSSGRGGLNIKLIGQFAVLVPPLAIQQKFSNFLKEIDKSKYREAIFLYLLEDIRICCNI